MSLMLKIEVFQVSNLNLDKINIKKIKRLGRIRSRDVEFPIHVSIYCANHQLSEIYNTSFIYKHILFVILIRSNNGFLMLRQVWNFYTIFQGA